VFNLRRHVLWFLLSFGWVVCAPLAQAVTSTAPSGDPPALLLPVQVRTEAEIENADVQEPNTVARAQVNNAYGRLPMHFEPNRGQAVEAVKYLARGRGYALFLTDTEMVLSLRKGTPKVGAASSRDVQTVSSQEMQQPMSPDRPVAAKCRSHRCVAESRQALKVVGAASSRDVPEVVEAASSRDVQTPSSHDESSAQQDASRGPPWCGCDSRAPRPIVSRFWRGWSGCRARAIISSAMTRNGGILWSA